MSEICFLDLIFLLFWLSSLMSLCLSLVTKDKVPRWVRGGMPLNQCRRSGRVWAEMFVFLFFSFLFLFFSFYFEEEKEKTNRNKRSVRLHWYASKRKRRKTRNYALDISFGPPVEDSFFKNLFSLFIRHERRQKMLKK